MPVAVVVGAGAAGCFCAINLKRRCPELDVIVLERGSRPLAKVAITGGGRCNLTNSFAEVRSLEKVYPRGHQLMKRALKTFSHEDTMRWFEREGVRLVVQNDQCVFPRSQDAMEIVNTLTRLMQKEGVKLITNCEITSLTPLTPSPIERGSKNAARFKIHTQPDISNTLPLSGGVGGGLYVDYVILSTGGSRTFPFLSSFDLEIVPPIPSLFTFNIADDQLKSLMGTVVNPVSVRLSGTKFQAEGPLLITHWGMSGPAILKLSSYAARHLAEHDYQAQLAVNWFGEKNEQEVLAMLNAVATDNLHKQIANARPMQTAITQALWLYIINKVGLSAEKPWKEVGPKQRNRLAAMLTNDTYQVIGRGQYKEEFVTCGGVALSSLNPQTLESKQYPGLYFAGEVTDVDAITGGFNLQAAWTMGYIVSQSIEI